MYFLTGHRRFTGVKHITGSTCKEYIGRKLRHDTYLRHTALQNKCLGNKTQLLTMIQLYIIVIRTKLRNNVWFCDRYGQTKMRFVETHNKYTL